MADIIVKVQDGLGLKATPTTADNSNAVTDHLAVTSSFEDNYLNSKQVTEDYNVTETPSVGSDLQKSVQDDYSIQETSEKTNARVEEYDQSVIVTDSNNALPQNNPQGELDIIIGDVGNVDPTDKPTKEFEQVISITDSVIGNLIINISSPTILEEFIDGDDVTFSATVELEGEPVSAGNIVWISSIDGRIEIGNGFDYNKLSVGTHVIELRVVGRHEKSSVQIIVNENTKSSRPEGLTES